MVAGAASSASGLARGVGRVPAVIGVTSGAEVRPWSTTLSATVTTTVVSTTSPSGTPRSSASSANTSEASPRGPNQPMKATVGRRTPRPASAMATGTIRTTVRLRAA